MHSISRLFRVIALATFLVESPGPLSAAAANAPALPRSGAQARARAGFADLPLYFEKNRGQTDASVQFFTRASGYNLFLTGAETVMVLGRAKGAASREPVVVRMTLKGADPAASASGRDIMPGRSSYFLGPDRSKWRVGVEQYAQVRFRRVYPGIDMIYYGKQGRVEHDFVVAPGANPGRILIGFEGGKGLRLDPQGNLILGVEGGELTYQAPTLYQMRGAARVAVKGRFALAGKNQVRFEVGDYVRSKELVIDPQLMYSSYLGGTADDKAYAVAVDAAGNSYLTGSTVSTLFPGAAGHLQSANGGGADDAFVTKISAAGTLTWSTYLGGVGDDAGLGVAVDGAGKVYITGSTTGGIPLHTSSGTLGGTDAFAAAISADGGSLIYAVQFGGPGEESGNGIAVDAAGDAYVTGHTTSMAAASFPVTAGAAQPAGGGADDAFATKFDPAGVMTYSTYLGGTGLDHGNAIAVDGLGDAYVTGQCAAAFPVGPLAPPAAAVFKPSITGSFDAFVAKLNPSGSSFLYSTYVGGSGVDEGTAIALDAANDVYITGFTGSADFPGNGFVATGQTTIGTAPDAFVFKLRMGNGGGISDGVYSTYLGASGDDRGAAIAVDRLGNAYVTGRTSSSDFPTVAPLPGQGTLAGSAAAFVTQISSTGGSRGFSTYLGGSTDNGGQGIALDSANNIYVTGWTNSGNFPTANPIQAGLSGGFDAFVTQISAAVDIASPTIAIALPTNGAFQNYASTTAVINYADTGGSGLNLASLVVKLDGVPVAATAGAGQATVVLAGLAQGAHTVDASIADNAGNQTAATQHVFTVDLAAPAIAVASPTAGSFLNYASTAAIINYSDAGGSGLNLASLVVKLDGTPVAATAGASQATANLTGLAQGVHTLDASIADNAGNLTAATQHTFTVDLSSPAIAVASPTAGSFMNYASTAAIIDYSDAGGSGLNLASLVVKLDGVPVAATAGAGQATASLAGLAQGVHTLDASITDNAGNLTAAAQHAFTVDLSSPVIAIASPTAGSFMNYASTAAIINYSDAGGSGLNLASLVVKLDGTPVAATAGAGQATVVLAGLAQGVHTVDASIADNAGNLTAAAQHAFTVGLSSPTIAIASPTAGGFLNYASTAAIVNYADGSGSGLNLASLVVKLDGTPVAATAGASQATANLTGLAQGVHTVDAAIADNAGNLTAATQRTFTVDLSSPVIAIASPTAGSFVNSASTAAIVNYSDAGGSGLNLASLVVKLDGVPVAATAGASRATVSLTGLTQGVHTLNASIADNAGNLTAAAPVSFTVDFPPAIAVIAPLNGGFFTFLSTTATIDYSDAGGSGVNVASLVVKLDGVAVAAAAGASRATANLSGLASGLHTVNASIADNAGNLTAAAQVSFTITLSSPTIAIALPPNGGSMNYASTTAVVNYADAGGPGLNLASLAVRLDGSLVTGTVRANQAAVNLAGMAAGVHTLTAFIADNAGNSAVAQSTFTVNLTPPPPVCTISRVEPGSGYTLGGATVTITGTGFSGLSGPSGVAFDAAAASSYAVNASSTVIAAISPAHPSAGAVSLTVTGAGGACSATYLYFVAPVAAGACGDDYFFPSPAAGAVGNFAYCMDQAGTARIRVFNAIGDIVAKLEDDKPAGAQLSTLNTGRLAPGVYLYLLEKDYGGGNAFHSRVKKFVVRR